MKTLPRLFWLSSALLLADNSFGDGLGVDLTFTTQYQQLVDDSAQLTSVGITPFYTFGNWEFAATLPYTYTEGSYFRNSVRPLVQNLCDRLLALENWQQQLLIRRGRLTAERLDECRQLDDTGGEYNLYSHGTGDAAASVRYSFTLDNAANWLAFLGLGYSHDNGDYAEGLGKGSRDIDVNAGLLYSMGAATYSLAGHYSFVHPTDATDDIQDYARIALSIDYAFTDYLTVGGEYGYEQSYFVGLDDINTFTLFLDLQFEADWSAHLFGSRYLNGDEFTPDQEFGLQLRYTIQ